jgi:hypothetical protein
VIVKYVKNGKYVDRGENFVGFDVKAIFSDSQTTSRHERVNAMY